MTLIRAVDTAFAALCPNHFLLLAVICLPCQFLGISAATLEELQAFIIIILCSVKTSIIRA